MLRKKIVLDTNVLLYDPLVFKNFQEAELYIPLPVLEELDAFKLERNETGRNARLASKILEQISSMGSLQEGILLNQDNGHFLGKIDQNFDVIIRTASCHKLPQSHQDFAVDAVDNRLLSLCKQLTEQDGHPVTLITRDINLRIKARSIGILTLEYEQSPVDTEPYMGWQEEWLEAYELKALSASNLDTHFALAEFKPNQFLLVRCKTNPDKYRIFRKTGAGHFNEIADFPKIWGFAPRNPFQAMAFDLLLDDSIPLVFLSGAAGTGKTLLTILAGLYKATIERRYDKLFVARPLVSLGADIGFIPGDLQEKLFHWMHPFYDNLEYIFNQMQARGESFDLPRGQSQTTHFTPGSGNRRDRRDRNRGFHHSPPGRGTEVMFQNQAQEYVSMLQQRGYLSLEAITHMRGRSLPNQYIFIDEAQNLSPQEIKTIITRAGEGTKVVMAGDPYQIDSQHLDFYNNGLAVSSLKLRGEALVGQVFMDFSERSDLARLAIEKL